MAQLPQVGGDENTWGEVLNTYLAVSLDTDGTLKNTALTTKAIFNAKIEPAVGSPTAVTYIWVGDQTAYDAIVSKSATTLYFIQ